MKQISFVFLFLLLVSCSSKEELSNDEKLYANEFMSYMLNVHELSFTDQDSKSFLMIGVDCYSCSASFIEAFANESRVSNLVPVICGEEGSLEITDFVKTIVEKYPETLVDRKNLLARYKVSKSGKSTLIRLEEGNVVDYWDLGDSREYFNQNEDNKIAKLLEGPL